MGKNEMMAAIYFTYTVLHCCSLCRMLVLTCRRPVLCLRWSLYYYIYCPSILLLFWGIDQVRMSQKVTNIFTNRVWIKLCICSWVNKFDPQRIFNTRNQFSQTRNIYWPSCICFVFALHLFIVHKLLKSCVSSTAILLVYSNSIHSVL